MESLTKEEYRKIIPIGKPYLTTVNGKLVFARDKPKEESSEEEEEVEEPSKSTLDLLGEAFGVRTKIVHHKRAKSAEMPATEPVVIGGVTYVPLAQTVPSTAPIAQQPFPPHQQPFPGPATPVQYYPYYPQAFYPPPPPPSPLPLPQQSRGFFSRARAPSKPEVTRLVELEEDEPKVEIVEVKTTITQIRHICAECGSVRSRRFHVANPIKPGEIPPPMFCGRCQRDASFTSEADVELDIRNRRTGGEKKLPGQRDKGKGKERAETKKSYVESDREEEVEEDESSGFLRMLSFANILRKSEKRHDQEKSKKNSKSSQKPTVTFDSPIAKENRQPKRDERNVKNRKNVNSEEPPKLRRARRSSHSPTRSRQPEVDKDASRRTHSSSHPPPRPGQTENGKPESGRTRRSTHSPSSSSRQPEAEKPASRRTRSSAHSTTSSRQPEVDKPVSRHRRSSARSPSRSREAEAGKADQGPPLPSKIREEPHKNNKRSSSEVHTMVFEAPAVELRDSARKGSKEVPEHDKRSQEQSRKSSSKQDHVSSRESHSTRSHKSNEQLRKAPNVENEKHDKHYHDQADQLPKRKHPSHQSSSEESDTGYLDNSDSRRAETGYDVSEPSGSHSSSDKYGNYQHPKATEYVSSNSNDANARNPRTRRSRHDSRESDSSQSTASHHVLRRNSSSTHTSSAKHRHSSHEPGSEEKTPRGSVRSSSEISTVKGHKQRSQKSSSPAPDTAWVQPLPTESVSKSTGTASSEHKAAKNEKEKSTYTEKDSDVGSLGAPSRSRMSRAHYYSAFETTEKEYTTQASILNEYRPPKELDRDRFASHGVQDPKSESSSQARHRRRSERTVDANSSFSSQRQSSRQSNTNSRRTSYQSGAGNESDKEENSQWNRAIEEGDYQNESGFSASNAAKYFRNDWKDNKSDDQCHNLQPSNRRSNASRSERSFTTADASKLYQKTWAAEDDDDGDAKSVESLKTPPQRVHSSEPDPTSSQVKEFFEGQDPYKKTPSIPRPPLFIHPEAEDKSLQVSPIRRGFNSSQGKHRKAPSTILEGSEHVPSAPASIYGLGLRGVNHPRSGASSRRSSMEIVSRQHSLHASKQSSPIIGIVTSAESTNSTSTSRQSSGALVSSQEDTQNTRRASQGSSPIIGIVSPAESVIHTPAEDPDETSDSGSDTTIDGDDGFDEEPTPRGTQTAATSFEDPVVASAANSEWFHPTESQLDTNERQDAVPGSGLGGLAGEGVSAQASGGSPTAETSKNGWDILTGSQLDEMTRQDAVPVFGWGGLGGGSSSAQNGGSVSPGVNQGGHEANSEKDSDVHEDASHGSENASQGDGQSDTIRSPSIGWNAGMEEKTGDQSGGGGGGDGW